MKSIDAVSLLKSNFAEGILNKTEFLGEVTLEIHKDYLKKILGFVKQVPNPGFEVLMDLTGVDYLSPVKQTKVVYWLQSPSDYERLRIAVYVPRDETIPSVTDLWEGANWYEREIFDFFGIKFEGHPHLKRILMPDNWEGYPWRRDYPLTEESVEFKHGVKPKIPSRIIPHVKSS